MNPETRKIIIDSVVLGIPIALGLLVTFLGITHPLLVYANTLPVILKLQVTIAALFALVGGVEIAIAMTRVVCDIYEKIRRFLF